MADDSAQEFQAARACARSEDRRVLHRRAPAEHESLARPWRRTARGDLYATAAAHEDPRANRDSF